MRAMGHDPKRKAESQTNSDWPSALGFPLIALADRPSRFQLNVFYPVVKAEGSGEMRFPELGREFDSDGSK
jgi:hypothetical protein